MPCRPALPQRENSVPQRLRCGGDPGSTSRDEFLDVERIAPTAPLYVFDARSIYAGVDRSDQLHRGCLIQRAKVDPLAVRAPPDLRQRSEQWVAAMQFVGSERADEHQRAKAGNSRERVEEPPRRRVRPMQIFDDHDDGSCDCKPSEHTDDELTEAITRQRFSGPKFRQRRMSLELWNEGSEHATNPTEHRCERLAIEIFHELSDDLTQRRQRPAQLALVDASAGNESETMLGSARRELSEQTCLPDARLTGDQSHRGPAFSRRFERGQQPSELVAATDDGRAHRPQPHGGHHPTSVKYCDPGSLMPWLTTGGHDRRRVLRLRVRTWKPDEVCVAIRSRR